MTSDPDDETLRSLLREGATLNEIARQYDCEVGDLLKRVADLLGQNDDQGPRSESRDKKAIDLLDHLRRKR